MRITITAPEIGSGTAFILCDDTVSTVPGTSWPNGAGGQCKEGFTPSQKRVVQMTPLARSAYQFLAPRYNLGNTLAFTVQRSFTSVENCIIFLSNHLDLIPAQGELWLYNLDASGVINRYLPGAVLSDAKCVKHIGAACDIQYTFAGNTAWQSTT